MISGELAGDGLVDAQRAASRQYEGRTTVADLLVLAVGRALAEVRELNGWVHADGQVERADGVDIAVALAGADGTALPVLRGADQLPLERVAEERTRLADAAREGTLSESETEGASCTFWNLGAYPVDLFTPAAPEGDQIALVTTGRVIEKPISFQRMLTIRPRIWVGVSIDPRGADPDAGGRFLAALQRGLNDLPSAIA